MRRGSLLVAGCLVAGCLVVGLGPGKPAPAAADVPVPAANVPAANLPAADAPPLSTWERAAYKTLTFQTAANLADAALFAAISGTGPGTGAIFLAANTASAALLYYPYELGWDVLGPPPAATDARTIAVKTVGYQVLTSVRNLALSYAFTGALLPSAGFAAAAFAIDSGIYAGNEVAWDLFRPRAASPPPQPRQGGIRQ